MQPFGRLKFRTSLTFVSHVYLRAYDDDLMTRQKCLSSYAIEKKGHMPYSFAAAVRERVTPEKGGELGI